MWYDILCSWYMFSMLRNILDMAKMLLFWLHWFLIGLEHGLVIKHIFIIAIWSSHITSCTRLPENKMNYKKFYSHKDTNMWPIRWIPAYKGEAFTPFGQPDETLVSNYSKKHLSQSGVYCKDFCDNCEWRQE